MNVPHFSNGGVGRCCIALLLLSPLTCQACAVPVFRYALENWQPDRLTVAILHDGPLSTEQAEVLEKLNDAADSENSANLATHPIDVRGDHPRNSPEAYYAAKWKDTDLPRMLVFFNNNAPEPQLAWSGSFDAQNIDKLLDSPARREVVERLLDGQSAVWVLLKTGNKADDERAEKELLEELKKQPDEIDLPSLTDLASEEKFDEDLQVEMRVEFSLISIEPADPREAFFREMLLNTESDLKDFEGPIAIPIYGRGRTYFALVGPGITADNIADNCNFICGACSCEVKRDNPGQDLLLAANWNRVQPGNWVNDTPLPELTGIGGLASLVDMDDDTTDASVDASDNDSQKLVSDSNHGKVAEVGESPQADITGEADSGQLLAAHGVEQDAASGAAPRIQSLPQAAASKVSGSRGNVAPVVLVWGAVLFGMGLVFTVWQRSRNAD